MRLVRPTTAMLAVLTTFTTALALIAAPAASAGVATDPTSIVSQDAAADDASDPSDTSDEAVSSGLLDPATAPAINSDGTINGTIDAHAHVTASAAFGGSLICGEPIGDPAEALAPCPSHAGVQPGSLLEAVLGGTDISPVDDGWPTFNDWPTPDSQLHQLSYIDQLKRTWQAGVPVVNTVLVGNRVICELYPDKVTPCDEAEQIRAQAALLNEMEAERDWFRVTRTPAEVRDAVANGQLAVTVGVESSEVFGCRVLNGADQCDRNDIDAGLDEFEALGVSSFHPVHKFDNALGGTRMDPDITGAALNAGNLLSTGRPWQVESCSGPSDHPQALPGYPEGDVCNVRGLTDLGRYVIVQMMDRGMIIQIDHMGVRTALEVLDMAEEAGYSGLAAVHTWSDRAVVGRIAQLGGFVSSYAYSAADAGNDEPDFLAEWRANRAAVSEAGGSLGSYGFGSDVNGLAPQPAARLNAGEAPLEYPFTSPNGATFDRQQTGERTFDLNDDGVAHYGLYADWFADVIDQAGSDGPALAAMMMNGAEGYTSMWEEARAWATA